jgi:hypothetical protein
VRARFGVTLAGGVGFRTIAALLASRVEYRRMEVIDELEIDGHPRIVAVLRAAS